MVERSKSSARNKVSVDHQQSGNERYLNPSCVSHRSSSKHESKVDASNRTELDANLAESGVYTQIHDGDKDDECERIDVLQEVVRNPMTFHFTGLRNQIVQHLIIAHPVNRKEKEDSTGD